MQLLAAANTHHQFHHPPGVEIDSQRDKSHSFFDSPLPKLVELTGVDVPVPDYTIVSKRRGELATRLETSTATTPRHVVVDSPV